MKKNNSYLADDEIDLADIIRLLYREKILILSISIICGLLGYLIASFQPQEFRTEIKFQNPPPQLFEPYNFLTNNNNNNKNNNNNNYAGQFIFDFKLKFISLDNLESFLQESQNHDNFKEYLKSKNTTVQKYFKNNFGQVKEKNTIIDNKYFLFFEKKYLDGDIFLNNYAEFTKKKSITELKKNLKLLIENRINSYEQALVAAKSINLENPILKSLNNQVQVVNEPEDLFYKGSKILTQNIIDLQKLLKKLENDQFNFNLILDKASQPTLNSLDLYLFFVFGLIIGFLLSLVIIFLKSIFKEKL